MPNVTPYEPYAALAGVYAQAGFANYGATMAPRLLDLAFAQDWVGRVVIDLGSGSGEVATWLAGHGYRVMAVEQSAAMLTVAQSLAAQHNATVEWLPSDIRTFTPDTHADLAFCLGSTLNLLTTLGDLESVFRQVSAALDPDKLFIFDLRTIRGLAAAGTGDRIAFDDDTAFIVTRSSFNYETLSLTTHYDIVRHDGIGWRRGQETHIARGFPVQAVVRALSKYGFRLLRTLNTALEPVDPTTSDQLIFVAQKMGTGSAGAS
jgi:SAM-dependent methyltransferase